MPSRIQVQVLQNCPGRIAKRPIRQALEATLEACGILNGAANVCLITPEEMAQLNSEFRSVAAPTDVLTFPAPSFPPGQVGDIAICVQIARQQAKARGVVLGDELQFLTIHGGLHLAGFDDETDAEREDMVRRMNEIATGLGLARDHEWWSRHYGFGGQH